MRLKKHLLKLIPFLFLGIAIFFPKETAHAASTDMTIEIEQEVSMELKTYTGMQPYLSGEGKMVLFCDEQYLHQVVDSSVVGELEILCPNGEVYVPTDASINFSHTLSSYKGYRNQEQRNVGTDTWERGFRCWYNIFLPVSWDLLQNGTGTYKATVRFRFQAREDYGVYNGSLDFTSWEDLISSGEVVMTDDRTLSSVTRAGTLLDIPPTVTTLSEGCFQGSYYYDNVYLPASVTSGAYAFKDANLFRLTLAEGTTTVPEKLCSGCSTLYALMVPSTLTRFEDECFYNCSKMGYCIFPDNASFGNKSFSRTGLKYFAMKQGMSFDEAFSEEESPFYNNAFQTILIMNGVETLPNYLFANSPAVTSISLPASLKTIGNKVFSGCSLERVTIQSDLSRVDESTTTGAIVDCEIKEIYLFSKITKLPRYLFYGSCETESETMTKMQLPASIKTIEEGVFSPNAIYQVSYGGSISAYNALNKAADFNPTYITCLGVDSSLSALTASLCVTSNDLSEELLSLETEEEEIEEEETDIQETEETIVEEIEEPVIEEEVIEEPADDTELTEETEEEVEEVPTEEIEETIEEPIEPVEEVIPNGGD